MRFYQSWRFHTDAEDVDTEVADYRFAILQTVEEQEGKENSASV